MKTQQQRDEEVISIIGNKTETIPLDLAYEILKRLPIKSLMKFRCVSKHWCSITRSRPFTDYIMSRSPPRLLLAYVDGIKILFTSSPLLPQDSNHSSPIVSIDMLDTRISRINNSVNGISLWSLSDGHFLICNPTTRQVLKIPNDMSRFDPNKYCTMGLGYDPANDQYKILRRVTHQDGSVQHSVCTLEKGQQYPFSAWRHVESNLSYYILMRDCSFYGVMLDEICINGVMYCNSAIEQSNKSSFVIESFDVRSEELRVIEKPKEFELAPHTLINYRGELAFFIINYNDNSYTLWFLEKEIWLNKADVFPPSACDGSIFRSIVRGTTNAGEIVFLNRDSLEFFIYDLRTKNVTGRVKNGAGRRVHNAVRDNATVYAHVDDIIIF